MTRFDFFFSIVSHSLAITSLWNITKIIGTKNLPQITQIHLIMYLTFWSTKPLLVAQFVSNINLYLNWQNINFADIFRCINHLLILFTMSTISFPYQAVMVKFFLLLFFRPNDDDGDGESGKKILVMKG